MTVPGSFLAFLEDQRLRVRRQCVHGRAIREWQRARPSLEDYDARQTDRMLFEAEARKGMRFGQGYEVSRRG